MVYKWLNNNLSYVKDAFFSVSFPATCVLCSASGRKYLRTEAIWDKQDLCEPCYQSLPHIRHACYCCGIELQTDPVAPLNPDISLRICGVCIKNQPAFDHAKALFNYETPISWLIQRLKFNDKLQYARLLGELMAVRVQNDIQANHESLPELIIPVPLHVSRLKERGFNQAIEISRPISKSLNIPLSINDCIRVVNTPHQMDLPAKQRLSNVRNIFEIKKTVEKGSLKKHIAIVDDVVTTGATVNELAKVLKAYGVERVDVWTVARTLVY